MAVAPKVTVKNKQMFFLCLKFVREVFAFFLFFIFAFHYIGYYAMCYRRMAYKFMLVLDAFNVV